MTYQGRDRRGCRGRDLAVNNGDSFEYDNANPNRNEIKELNEQVASLYYNVRRLQRPTERKDSISLEGHYDAPHWHKANSVRYECTSVNDIDNELPKFDGSSNSQEFVNWLNTIDNVFEYYFVTKEKNVKLVSTCLKGSAYDWWKLLE